MPAQFSNYTVTMKDQSGETSTFTCPCPDLEPLSTDQSALTTSLNTLKATLEGISRGNTQKAGGSWHTRESNQPSVSGDRELKLLVQLEDQTTFTIHTLEIPIIDQASITWKTNSDEVDLGASPRGGTDFDAFATALEAVYVSPAGNSVVVVGARLIGRNL